MSGTHQRGGTAGQDGTPLKGCVPLCPGPWFPECPDLSRFVPLSRSVCPGLFQPLGVLVYSCVECQAEFRLLNFAESSHINEQGKEQHCYQITSGGFSFIAMVITVKDSYGSSPAMTGAGNSHPVFSLVTGCS